MRETVFRLLQGNFIMTCSNEVYVLVISCDTEIVDLTRIPTPPPLSFSGSFLILCASAYSHDFLCQQLFCFYLISTKSPL